MSSAASYKKSKNTGIAVYIFDASSEAVPSEEMMRSLPPLICERCSIAKNEISKKERFFAYSVLFYALSKLGKNPQKCKTLFTKEGKPYLDNEKIQFSISHSGGVVCVAIAECDLPLGVDIQLSDNENSDKVNRLVSRFLGGVSPSDLVKEYALRDSGEKITLHCLGLQNDGSFTQGGNSEKNLPRLSLFTGNPPSPHLLWTMLEATLKRDGRGFGAASELAELLSHTRLASCELTLEEKTLFLTLAY